MDAASVATSAGAPDATPADAASAALAQQAELTSNALPASARAALSRIPDFGRRLLATRAYLRAGDALQERWSWTASEASAFARSADGQALERAVRAVRCTFDTANPGYTLYVNPEFRTLEIQVQRWNQNDSVGRAAARLLDLARRAAQSSAGASMAPSGSAGAAGPSRSTPPWLAKWLVDHAPQPVPTLAAPGLSPHGRGSAIDFQVHRRGSVVAGPDSKRIDATWVAGGWAAKLSAAVAASGAGFEGPLQSPREPWHYRYAPDRASTKPLADCAKGV